MVISTLRHLPLHLSRTHSFTSTSFSSSSSKVFNRIVKLLTIDPTGAHREIIGLTGQTLLKALANAGLIEPASHQLEDINACSIEYKVHISYDEKYVMTRNSRNRVLNKHERLRCQVMLSYDL
ncbi:2Fe-2S ferredoxin-like protein [Dioscorea alata]|uniref:2Fe-2S ferredoxin-like protein n=1 Tax=Dioscorea alata TaxID=55571 RepID=A0ACB7VE05_DIOAL|nr:2Fe-2S ferredoxin-like protein [Dioscorea alata]